MNKLRMSWPNRITVARIIFIVPFVITMLHINDPKYEPWARYAALVVFVIMALSDALDGFLARRLNSATPLGRFLDPLADKLLITCACLLLASEPSAVAGARLPDAVVVIIIGKDLYTLLGFIIIYMITTEVKIAPAFMGKVSTTLQLSMVVTILISPDITRFWRGYQYVVQLLWFSAAIAAILTTIVYTRNGSRYLSEHEQQQKITLQQSNPGDTKKARQR